MAERYLRAYNPDAGSGANPAAPARSGYAEDVATGAHCRPGLVIAGRPRPGSTEWYILLEEPGDAVLLHWTGARLQPHFHRDCPHCPLHQTEPKPVYYVGACRRDGELVILELSPKCQRAAAAAAWQLGGWVGLVVKISRADFASSPRVLRCEQRLERALAWPHHTRREMARIWGIPTRPRIFRGESVG